MIINHNLGAANAMRNMGINQANSSKSMEKLSTGLRINKAGDDAAGLAISEKMRGQIRGLDQASANAQDAISMIQTAEGALSETTSIVQRMRELSVQASSDTNTAEDRLAVQKEVVQLKTEIDRIGNTTEFNTTKLIDGSIGAKVADGKAAVTSEVLGTETAAVTSAFTVLADTSGFDSTGAETAKITVDGAIINFDVTSSTYDSASASATDIATQLQTDINTAIDKYNTDNDANIAHVTVDENLGDITIKSGSTGSTSSIEYAVGATGAGNFYEKVLGATADATESVTGKEGTFEVGAMAKVNAFDATNKLMDVTIDGTTFQVSLDTVVANTYDGSSQDLEQLASDLQTDIRAGIASYNATVSDTSKHLSDVDVSIKDGKLLVKSQSTKESQSISFDNSKAAQLLGLAKADSKVQGGGVDFQIGANSGQKMNITIADMRTAALGIDKIDMSTKEGAQAATDLLDTALKTVSGQRADLGAYSNRLEHTIANLGTSSENLTSAESRIRDVNMAKEMSNFSKNNILSQAAQAMLAQANQQPQQVLQLLR